MPELDKVAVALVQDVLLELQGTDKRPDDAGDGEENRADDERVVVSETEHQISGRESSASSSDFVEDVDRSVHPS